MFEARTTPAIFTFCRLVYHATVRSVRQSHRSPILGLLLNMLQTTIILLAFVLLFQLLGLRGSKLRGDFLLFLLTGVFLYLTHIKTVMAVFNSEGPASPMMQHRPMSTAITICAAALSSLYLQTLSLLCILFIYHAAVTPIAIENPIGAYGMFLVAWISGVSVGMLLLAIKPWAPDLASILATVYRRINMLASGKMVVANGLPSFVMTLFDWNPLFHAIDQARGYTFLHYNPLFTSVSYPLLVSAVLIMIGLMAEFYTRKHASISWAAMQ